MDIILDISAWGNFLFSRLVLDAIFVPFFILLVLALFNRDEYRASASFRFLITALLVTLVSRYVFFVHTKTKINTRYLFTVAFYVIILCAPGLPILVRIVSYIFNFIPGKKEKVLSVFLIAAIGIACVSKALHAPEKKDYIHSIAKTVSTEEVAGKTLFISNVHDGQRIAWHSKAEFVPLSSVVDIGNLVNLQNAVKILGTKKHRIFFLLQLKNGELKKSFQSQNVKFPKRLIFMGEFKVKRKIFYSLYMVKASNNDNV